MLKHLKYFLTCSEKPEQNIELPFLASGSFVFVWKVVLFVLSSAFHFPYFLALCQIGLAVSLVERGGVCAHRWPDLTLFSRPLLQKRAACQNLQLLWALGLSPSIGLLINERPVKVNLGGYTVSATVSLPVMFLITGSPNLFFFFKSHSFWDRRVTKSNT